MPETPCPFCGIVRGELQAYRVWEDRATVAFLDRRPLFPGHCLVIPRIHAPTWEDLPPEATGPLFAAVQLLARAVERGLQADGTLVAINNRVSQSVPHLHVHVVPRRRGDGLRSFFWPRQRYARDEDAKAVAAAVAHAAAALAAQGSAR